MFEYMALAILVCAMLVGIWDMSPTIKVIVRWVDKLRQREVVSCANELSMATPLEWWLDDLASEMEAKVEEYLLEWSHLGQQRLLTLDRLAIDIAQRERQIFRLAGSWEDARVLTQSMDRLPLDYWDVTIPANREQEELVEYELEKLQLKSWIYTLRMDGMLEGQPLHHIHRQVRKHLAAVRPAAISLNRLAYDARQIVRDGMAAQAPDGASAEPCPF